MLRRLDERAQCGPALTRGDSHAPGQVTGPKTGQQTGQETDEQTVRDLRRAPLQRDARGYGWAGVGLGVVLAAAYFLAAQLGLALFCVVRNVPLVWPAAGIAVGALIALGPRARVPIAMGVLVATATVGLLAGRTPWTALGLGLCNAGQAVLTAWLVDRWCGRPFRFDDWHGLWGFLTAATLAAAGTSLIAVLIMQMDFAAASLPDLWRMWAAADGLGILLVAPVLVGLYHLAAEPMSRGELAEGSAAMTSLAAATLLVFAAPRGSPFSYVPPVVLFPFYLWIAARCRPLFVAAGALLGAVALICANTFRLGLFADGQVAIPTVQMMLLIGGLCALSLSALFAERRRSEAALRESNERLRLAVGGADLGVWSVDLSTGVFESDERDGRINGHDPDHPPQTLAEARRYLHPDDLPRLDAAFAAARRTGAACRAEYRVLNGDKLPPQHVRWAAMEGSVVSNAAGRPLRLMGVTRDITEQKRAEQALAERTAQLALAGRAGLVGSYVYDVASGMMQISPGFAAIYGLPEHTAEISRYDWGQRVDVDDMADILARSDRVFAAHQRELLAEYRIRRPDGEVRWIEQRTFIDYDATGAPRRSVGVNIDMTERKRDEEHQALLVAELDHRVKNVLAVVSALLARIGHTGVSGGALGDAKAVELVAALDGRIKSMATAHELLSRRNWHGLPIRALIECELEPYTSAGGGNIEIGGPDVVLKAEAGQAMAMVVHELVTNAAKYGALSVERGRVSVRWRLVPQNGAGAHLAVDWQETDGPRVTPSARVGYGTSVIRDLVPYELGGSADLAFPPEGARCHLQVPARWLTTAAGSGFGAPVRSAARSNGLSVAD